MFAAAAIRFAKAATSFFSPGSLISVTASIRLDPLHQPLIELGPALALSFHQQGKNLDLTFHRNTALVEQLIVIEDADRFRPGLSSNARLLEGFPRGRL